MNTTYEQFLAGKRRRAECAGFEAPELNKKLFPFQRDVVRWALRLGRAALFEECGLGKSWQALEWSRCVAEKTRRPVLILTPLAVAQQFVREGEKIGVPVMQLRGEPQPVYDYISTVEHTESARVVVCNYESLHKLEGVIPYLGGVVLDESSILKSFDGKTRTRLIETFGRTPYRLACTATPAPNDHVELGNHAEFLGVMSRVEMLSTFFVHDGGDTSKWRLKGHAVKDFWRWVCSWAVCLAKPSDMGYSDDGYILPELKTHEHIVDMDQEMARNAGMLFCYEATTLPEQRATRRTSLDRRVAVAADLVKSDGEQWLVWCELNDESAALAESIPGAVEISGSDATAFKEQAIMDFIDGKTRVLVTKPSIAGFGVNLQNCARQVFVGIGHSFEAWYQAVRRCWRFGQSRPVHAHVVVSSADGSVVRNLLRKQDDHAAMLKGMVEAMGYRDDLAPVLNTIHGCEEGRGWRVAHGDCVRVVGDMPADSVDFSVYSPPFASLYTYSASDADMGNCRSHDEFFEHYRFLLAELFRVTKPGRLSSVHCMILPTSKAHDGIIGLSDFPGEIIRAHQAAGWIYHSKVTVWKDPVTAMQRTKALGLLWKQIKKDSCMSRMGLPDEVLTFRKPGENPNPVSHSAEEFPVGQWQQWASPVWSDINPSDTLQYMSAREDEDERHICPLQLEVIRRCVRLWSNKGDLVLSPFTGIGSEGYVALQEKRRFTGAELKPSYFRQAVTNLRAIETQPRGLFE